MAKKVAELLTDDIVKHSIELQRVGNNLSNTISKELTNLTKQLESIVTDNDFSRSLSLAKRKTLLNNVIRDGNKVIATAHASLATTVKNNLIQVGNLETEFAIGSVNKAATNSGTIQIATETISAARISKIADNLILNGAPQAEMWSRQSRNLQNKFKDVIRTAWGNQESIPVVAQRIRGTAAINYKDGIMTTSRHHATSLGRTSIASVANQVREETYLQNLDVVEGVEFLAVLDSDTTPICRSHAGDVWLATPDGWKNESGGHEYRQPPLHFNCRSTLIPVIKDVSKLTPAKQKLVPDNKAKSLGKAVTPPRSADAWLKTQPEDYQKEVLGKAFATWQAGKISFKKFVTQKGRVRSTDELADLYSKGDVIPVGLQALNTTDNFKAYSGSSDAFKSELAKTNKVNFLSLERRAMLGEELSRVEVNKLGLILKNADPSDLEFKNSYKPADFSDFLNSKAKRLAFYNHTAKKFERTNAWKKGDLEKRKTSRLNDIDEQVLNQLKIKIADDRVMSATNKKILLEMFDESQRIVGSQRSLPMIESLFTLARKKDFSDIDDFAAYLSNAMKGSVNSYFARAKTFEIRLTSSTEKLARYNMLSENSKSLFYKDITRSDSIISNRISLAEASELQKKITTIGKRRLREFSDELPTPRGVNLELSTPESIELYLAYLNPNTRMSSTEVRKWMKRIRADKYRDGMTKSEKLHLDRVDFITKRTSPGDPIVLTDAILNNPLFAEWKEHLWTGRGFPPTVRKQVGEVLGDVETLQGLKFYLKDKINFKEGVDQVAHINKTVNKFVGEAAVLRTSRSSAVKKIENLYKLDGESRAKMRTLRDKNFDKKLNNDGFFAREARKEKKLTKAQKLEAKREFEDAKWENLVDAKYVGDVRDSIDELIIQNSRSSSAPFYNEAATIIGDDSVKLAQLINSQIMVSTQKGSTYIDTIKNVGEKYFFKFKGVLVPDEDQVIRMGHFLTEALVKTKVVNRVKTMQMVSKPGYPPREQLTWRLTVANKEWENAILANKKNYDVDGLPVVGKAPKLDSDGMWEGGQSSIRGVNKDWVADKVKQPSSKPWKDNLNIEAGTGIKVNGYIYDVMTELEKKGKKVIPSRPANKSDVVNRSKFDSYMRSRNLARGLRDDTFYNRMSNDKFARTYADAVALHWQGDDINRGLMMFSKGKKLGKGGYADFTRNFMNISGYDKIPMKTRMALFDKIPDKLIIATAKDPVKYDWWYTENNWIDSGIFKNLNGLDKRDVEEILKLASKGNPGDEGAFQALAMIKERAEMIKWVKDGNKLEDFISFLPSQRDGTTNVLQHFAGISRDKSIAKAVNMTKQRGVADAYIQLRDTMDDIGRGLVSTDPLKKYIDVPGLSHAKRRKSVKKGLMTAQYNAGPQTLGDGYFEALFDVQVKGKFIFREATSAERLAVGRVMLQAAEKQFPQATKVRHLLNNFAEAHEIAAAKTIEVKTPLGFPFRQAYNKTETRQVELSLQGGAKMKLDVRVELDDIDYGKQNRAFAPNIIHSMDASHKSLVANRLYKKYGITDFSMIHDSFGAHFGNMDLLLKETRLAFLEMYEGKNFMLYLFDNFKKQGVKMKRFVRNEKGIKIKDGKGGFLTEDIPMSEIEDFGDYNFEDFEKLEYFFH